MFACVGPTSAFGQLPLDFFGWLQYVEFSSVASSTGYEMFFLEFSTDFNWYRICHQLSLLKLLKTLLGFMTSNGCREHSFQFEKWKGSRSSVGFPRGQIGSSMKEAKV